MPIAKSLCFFLLHLYATAISRPCHVWTECSMVEAKRTNVRPISGSVPHFRSVLERLSMRFTRNIFNVLSKASRAKSSGCHLKSKFLWRFPLFAIVFPLLFSPSLYLSLSVCFCTSPSIYRAFCISHVRLGISFVCTGRIREVFLDIFFFFLLYRKLWQRRKRRVGLDFAWRSFF